MGSLDILSNKTHQRIPVSRISFIERQAQKIIVHTDTEDFTCYRKTVDEFEKQLAPRGFLRINQSCLVSAARVIAFGRTFLSIHGHFFTISRKNQSRCFQYLQARHNGGVITCYGGPFSRGYIYVMAEQTIMIGQDDESADLVINMPRVCQPHASICYHPKEQTYTLIDYSTSGTSIGGKQIPVNTPVSCPIGSMMCLGRDCALYELGIKPTKIPVCEPQTRH